MPLNKSTNGNVQSCCFSLMVKDQAREIKIRKNKQRNKQTKKQLLLLLIVFYNLISIYSYFNSDIHVDIHFLILISTLVFFFILISMLIFFFYSDIHVDISALSFSYSFKAPLIYTLLFHSFEQFKTTPPFPLAPVHFILCCLRPFYWRHS